MQSSCSRVVFMFPGQSSCAPGILEAARDLAPQVARVILQEASDIVGRDVVAHCPGGPASAGRNVDVQVSVFVANHIHLCAASAAGIRTQSSLGLSLGEYNHLVHIGALSFGDALRLVEARGHAYDGGPSGAMVAVFPLEAAELDPLVERARSAGAIDVSNYNSPVQHVVAGERAAIDAFLALVEDETFASAVVIEDRIPMHTARFRPVAEVLAEALAEVAWQRATAPYLPNVTAAYLEDPTGPQIAELLGRHVFEAVRWRDSIEAVLEQGPEPAFVEVGPGHVLCGLMRRPWLEVSRFATQDRAELDAVVEHLTRAGLRAG